MRRPVKYRQSGTMTDPRMAHRVNTKAGAVDFGHVHAASEIRPCRDLSLASNPVLRFTYLMRIESGTLA